MAKNKKLTVHVISGTHWDREWRFAAEQSKVLLARTVDHAMDILESQPGFHSFMLDGGTIIPEDYFAARPEEKERFLELVRQGRLILMPWYTLPEMNLVAPESIVRNLLVGRQVGRDFGGTMACAYTATSYGQPAQMPQILRSFGIRDMFFYRGVNKHTGNAPAFTWKAPDGSEILVVKGFDEFTRNNFHFYAFFPTFLGSLPGRQNRTFDPRFWPVHFADRQGYWLDFEFLNEDTTLPDDPERYRQGIRWIHGHTDKYRIGNVGLALDVEDYNQPFVNLPELVARLNAAARKEGLPVELIQSSYDHYVRAIRAEFSEKDFEKIRGECRQETIEHGYNGLLGAVGSARIHLKVLNHECETNLSYYAEPFSLFSSALGARYAGVFFKENWKILLANHAHDSICGAAVDRAHRDMLHGFSKVKASSDEIIRRSVEQIWTRINNLKVVQGNEDLTLTVFNTLPWERRETAEVTLDVPTTTMLKWDQMVIDKALKFEDVSKIHGLGAAFFDIVDETGAKVAYTVLRKENIGIRVNSSFQSTSMLGVIRYTLQMELEAPGLGYKTYGVQFRPPEYTTEAQPLPEGRKWIARDDGVLENEFLRVRIQPNGTFDLTEKESGRVFSGLHYFTDEGETGSAHVTQPPKYDHVITSLGCAARIIRESTSPFCGVYRIDLTLQVPGGCAKAGDERLKDWLVDLPVSTWITLRKNSRRVELKTRIFNRAWDHRLAVQFPTGMASAKAYVEAPFVIQERDTRWTDTQDNAKPHFPYNPMLSFVALPDSKGVFAFLSKGLREYAVQDDAARTLSVTLLRTHRSHMLANGNMNQEELKELAPGAHMLGEHEVEYGLHVHGGKWEPVHALQAAYDFLLPVRIMQGVPNGKGELPPTGSFLQLKPGSLVYSALKKAEEGDAWILRLWNPVQKPVDAEVAVTLPGWKLKGAWLVNCAEEEVQRLACSKNRVKFKFGQGAIVTLKLDVQT